MNLISESYRQQNRQLHENPGYGISGAKFLDEVLMLSRLFKSQDILDYGCGKRYLETALGFPINNYDPAISGLDSTPEPADLVICTDVLEHIEPDYLDNVLDDLKRATKRACFLVIANRPAQKILPDGRNAHLIQEDGNWWLPKILSRFKIAAFKQSGTKLMFICEAK